MAFSPPPSTFFFSVFPRIKNACFLSGHKCCRPPGGPERCVTTARFVIPPWAPITNNFSHTPLYFKTSQHQENSSPLHLNTGHAQGFRISPREKHGFEQKKRIIFIKSSFITTSAMEGAAPSRFPSRKKSFLPGSSREKHIHYEGGNSCQRRGYLVHVTVSTIFYIFSPPPREVAFSVLWINSRIKKNFAGLV